MKDEKKSGICSAAPSFPCCPLKVWGADRVGRFQNRKEPDPLMKETSSLIPHPSSLPDRVGLGWRSALASGILANPGKIDLLEVIADDYFDASTREINALKTLSAQIPVILHGVSLGMASTSPVDPKRLDRMARLVDLVQPEMWSEHLAFVRAGGIEIGHLAAPPRTESVIEGTARNLETAKNVVGCIPVVENIATLIDPPGSRITESEWISGILTASGARLLLDLHNLYANAVNFDFDPFEFLNRIPLESVAQIHLAGGKWVTAKSHPGKRLLDDHLHDVPDPVFELLSEVARRADQPLTVILERDGAFPPIQRLLEELDTARTAIQKGRALKRSFSESAAHEFTRI